MNNLNRMNCCVLLKVQIISLIALSLGTHSFGEAEEPAAEPNGTILKQLKELYRSDAHEYRMYLSADRRQTAEIVREPVYTWTNVVREQTGSVFIWIFQGRPQAIGTIFSNPVPNGKRVVVHEFHSLAPTVLHPQRPGQNPWKPNVGLKRTPIAGAPIPSPIPRQRLAQMRELAKEFTARSIDLDRQEWELRQLTQPLYRYPQAEGEILDGALFAWVTSAGTDPEVVILIEALQEEGAPRWNSAICRFSDNDLHVAHRQKEVWSSIKNEENTWAHDPQHLYHLHVDRTIDEIVEKSPGP